METKLRKPVTRGIDEDKSENIERNRRVTIISSVAGNDDLLVRQAKHYDSQKNLHNSTPANYGGVGNRRFGGAEKIANIHATRCNRSVRKPAVVKFGGW